MPLWFCGPEHIDAVQKRGNHTKHAPNALLLRAGKCTAATKSQNKSKQKLQKINQKKQVQNCSCHMPLAKLQHRLERSAPKRNLSSHSCPVDIQSLWHPRKAYIRYKGPTPLRTTHTLISIGIILACFLRCTGDELAKRFRFSQGLF